LNGRRCSMRKLHRQVLSKPRAAVLSKVSEVAG
jgi:hypothetical protein